MVVKNALRRIGIVLVLISFVLIVMAAAPSLSNGGVSPLSGDTSTTFTFNVTFTDADNDTADYVRVNIDGVAYPMTGSDPTDFNTTDGKYYTSSSIGPFSNATHYYNFTTAANGSGTVSTTDSSFVVTLNPPTITDPLPVSSTVNSFTNHTQNFNVTVNQDANVSWKIGSIEVQNLSVLAGQKSYYSNSSIGAGTYQVTAQAINANGTSNVITWTWAVTQPNTQAGTNVRVSLAGNLNVVFASVTSEGNTTVVLSTTLGSETPPTFSKIGSYYYYISTNAGFTAPITVELNYTPPSGINESNIKLYHWESSSWVDKTTSIEISNDRVIGSLTNFSPVVAGAPPVPVIAKIDPTGSSLDTIGAATQTFKISVDQDATVTWYLGSTPLNTSSVLKGVTVEYTPSTPSTNTYDFSVKANNTNGTDTENWTWNVRPKTYASGNRIWDGGKDMSTTYTWSPMSFYAFYYDVDDNVGNESLKIILNSKTDRNVPADKLIYTTAPENVNFKYDKWGTYKVIGFMADKYFAGYTANTKIPDVDPVSTLNYKQLHKVLMDDKASHTLRASTTFPLGDGYALSLKDIGTGRVAMISITKDGGEVYTDFKEVGQTLVYTKKVGSINDLPIIVLHIGKVFMGTTESMVQIDGIFQISESYTSVSQNNNYGMMEITTVGDSGITMKNENSFTLSSGSTIDIMGDMKFIVANNDSVLRFAPMVKKTGEYEVRGTISNNETESLWTPLSFEGFYYNIDEDIGTESLKITRTDRNIGINNIEYSTSSALVSHKYGALGKYNVIGFMAEKYFAGYEVGLISDRVISTMGRNQLHKVLIDDDTQRIIYAGSTLTLNDGYVIKIKDVNMGAGSAEVWLSVLKDGNEVGDGVKSNGQVFTFEKDVGAVKDLPIIALRIQNIFRGKEATAAFVKGTFQISESYKTVKQGDNFDKMEVKTVSANTITMKNPSAISLDAGSSDTLMGKMRLKVADSSDIRYYPYILFNGSALAANQLAISVPSSMMVKDVITISVTSGAGTNADNAEVSFDGQVIGTTNSTGKLDYMLTKAGRHNLTATKLGFEKATKTVQISEYVDNRLSFELPEFIDQYIPVTIKVKVSGTGNVTSGVNVTFDGKSIGKTDSNGILTYTFTESGTHNLAASKPGYIDVQREISIRLPFIEFKALDINFMPNVVNKGQSVYVRANITNTGTKEGMLPVALIINSTVVENANVTLAPGKQGVANFTHKIELLPGNYTVEVLGQKTTMPVKEEPLNLFFVAGIITVLGAISIIVLTSKEILSIEALKAKLNMAPTTNKPVINTDAINRAIEDIKSKFKKK
ncbi:MAG: S-layer protein domain-containing protein [Candidatus Methanoperedens sp.]|nr:S-layer protein domain-containing protein [Candidatus Methanoperedens sp.]